MSGRAALANLSGVNDGRRSRILAWPRCRRRGSVERHECGRRRWRRTVRTVTTLARKISMLKVLLLFG